MWMLHYHAHAKDKESLSSIEWVQHGVSRIGQFFWEVFVFRVFGLRL